MSEEASEMKPIRKWSLVVLCIYGIQLGFIDLFNITFALPDIEKELHFTSASSIWILNSFLIAYTCALGIGGKIIGVLNRRVTFNTGIILFSIGVIINALSPTRSVLIVGRCLAGVGCGLLAPVSNMLLIQSFRKKERGVAAGVGYSIYTLCLIISPLICALVVQYIDWRLVFWLYVPFAALFFGLSFRLVGTEKVEGERLDIFCAILFTAFTYLLVYGILEGGQLGWDSWQIIGAFALSAACLAAFVFYIPRCKHPLIEPALFTSRSFSMLLILTFLFLLAVYSQIIWILYFIKDLHYTTVVVALINVYGTIPALIANPLGGYFAARFGYLRTIRWGLFLTFLGMLWVVIMYRSTNIYLFLPGLIAAAFFGPIAYVPCYTMSISVLPPPLRGQGSSLVAFMGIFATTVGIALYAALFHSFKIPMNGFLTVVATSTGLMLACYLFVLLMNKQDEADIVE